MNTHPIAASWRRFLIEETFDRNYPAYYSMSGGTARAARRNVVLDRLFPGLLYIKAVTILDAALISKLDDAKVKPKQHGFRNDLNGRIETAVKNGLLADSAALHRIRTARNDLAHEFSENVDWADLQADVAIINDALQQMGFVGPLPALGVSWERSPRTVCEDPNALIGYDYRIAVMEGANVWAEITYSEEILPATF